MAQRGYQLVDPGLATPRSALGKDEQVHCLSYLMRRIKQIMPIPEWVYFELIPAQYTGAPYPCIGLYTHKFIDTNEHLCDLAIAITEQLERLVEEVGLERLMMLSAEENACWQDVLDRFDERLSDSEAAAPILRPLDAENLTASGFNPWHS